MPSAGTLSRFAWPIVITTTTGAIRIEINGAADTIVIPAGTYYWLGDGTASDLAAALSAAILADFPAAAHTIYLDADGTVRIVFVAAYPNPTRILWADGATLADPVLFGFTAATYTWAGLPLTLSSPNQVGHLWNPERIYVDDSGAYPEHIRDRAVSLSGRSGTWLWGSRSYRDFLIDLLPAAKLLTADSPPNEGFELLYLWLASGGSAYWTPSILVPATRYLVGVRDDEWLSRWPVTRIDQVAGRFAIRFPLEML